MKKALAVLATSVAVLAGLLIYGSIATREDEQKTTEEYATAAEEVTQIAVTESDSEEQKKPATPAVVEDVVTVEADEEWNEDVEAEYQASVNTTYDLEIGDSSQYYAYNRLSDDEKELYALIYSAITQYDEKVFLPTLDTELVGKVYECVMMDHPEIFYVDGYKLVQYTVSGTLKRLSFAGNYTFSKNEADSLWQEMDATATAIIMNAPTGGDDYQKVKFVYEYLVNNTDYDLSAPNNQNIVSVFVGRRSVCKGYAKAAQLLLNRMGVYTTFIRGQAQGEGHAWNLVKSDGEWYHLDVVWGDAYAEITGNEGSFTGVNYDYLLVTTSDILRTHSIITPVDIPMCQSLADNYFVREGLFFLDYDDNLVQSVFDRARSTGQNTVTLKCANNDVYARMRSELLDNQKLFNFIGNGGSKVRYCENTDLFTITFWL